MPSRSLSGSTVSFKGRVIISSPQLKDFVDIITLNNRLSKERGAPITFRVSVFIPSNSGDSLTLVQVFPLSSEYCHWYDKLLIEEEETAK